ncbi:MAG: extracellular solute-binding protein [Clostridia bacterium]|nr:extracellular solute-binding protein [Clostridia bacterium]
MKNRIISLVLAMLTCLLAVSFASCGKDPVSGNETNNDVEVVETKDIQNETEYVSESLDPVITEDPMITAEAYDNDVTSGQYNYDGYEFTFLNSSDIWSMYVYIDPDMTGDVLDDSCFERNTLAEQYFNITIKEETETFAELANTAKTLILADEDAYDVMYIPARNLTPLISENLFYDLLEVEQLNIDRVWWDQPLIERNTIEGRLFYATSDLNLMAFEGVWCMYFNEDMIKSLGLALPYELALSGNWTFDELKKYCAAAANLNGDSSFTFSTEGDSVYGLANSNTMGYFAYGMGAEYCSRDENGRYYFSADTDPVFNSVWENIIGFFGPEDGMTVNTTGSDLADDGYFGVFEARRALFLHAELKGATMLREWDGNFGLLPQPKYSADQETYNSNILQNCLSFCIPNTNTNLERTGTIVDYLTYASYTDLLPKYYNIHVSLKALGKQESIDVLALIRGTRGVEVAVPYEWCGSLEGALKELAMKNEYSLASTLEKSKASIESAINKTYETYPTLRNVEE